MKSIAILHEDFGHKNLINSLLEYLNRKNHIMDTKLIDFYEIGSKSNFFKLESDPYETLKQRKEIAQLKKVLFVVDADYDKKDTDNKAGGFKKTQQELKNIICQLDLQDISEIYIIRNPNEEEGNLESMLLATLKEEKKKCIEEFIKCSDIKPKNFYKTIIYNLHKMAYPNDVYYNFEHPYFDELKEKLKNLFEIDN